MPDSRLTVRTLGLAMVALVLACVHAARGDGRVATFKGSAPAKGASSGGRGSNVNTVSGDPFKADARPNTPTSGAYQSQAARNAATKLRHDRAKSKAVASGTRAEPICIVRRAGDPMPAAPALPVPAPQPVVAAAPKPAPVTQTATRNAFAITPIMAQSAR